ncbi:MAG: DUF962 domain-containing protein [Gammaproteobacteria bacterium]|nr:DUF962 domain-containing protein [Gammaproteobacteria bacterium]
MSYIMPKKFDCFSEFYSFYLTEHTHRTSRRLHVVGTLGAFVQGLSAILWTQPWLAITAIFSAYSFAWAGHIFFEKNRPASFKHPFYSLCGDLALVRDVLAGKITW